jgi:hypothetical protein
MQGSQFSPLWFGLLVEFPSPLRDGLSRLAFPFIALALFVQRLPYLVAGMTALEQPLSLHVVNECPWARRCSVGVEEEAVLIGQCGNAGHQQDGWRNTKQNRHVGAIPPRHRKAW